MAASYIFNRIPHSALNMEMPYKKLYGKDADLSHLKIIGARDFVYINNPNKLGHTSREGTMCGFSETESNSYHIWNPKTRRVVESRNVVFIETPRNLLPAAKWLSPQQDLESPLYGYIDDTLDDNYVSHDDMLPHVQLHLRSGFQRRHACRNGRTVSASTSLTRRNFVWGSLARGNFARWSYTRGIIISTSARASPGAGARVCTRTSAYICFCGTKSN